MTSVQTNSSDEKKKPNVILAAGGIVWKHDSSQCPKIAVIHRTRYGGEWCLPKGKPEPDKKETLEEVALREVEEETGCKARITSFAGQSRYEVDGTPKVVNFWNMVVEGECAFYPSEEVDQVLWMSPQEAIRILDHHEEKKLLSNSYYGREIASKLLISSIFRFTNYRRYNRLAGTLRAYRLEVERRICGRQNNESDQGWIKAICKLLDACGLALDENNIEEGWKCFLAAQRMEIFGLTDGELKTKANLLRQESEKLSSWRKKATEDLLGKVEYPKNDINHEQVYQAALLRDEHYENQAYKDGLLRTHMATLVLILLVVVLTLILIPVDLISNSQNTINQPDLKMLVSIALFGLFGGAFSAALKVQTSMKSARIPELVHNIRLTLLRVFIGASSAIFLYIFLNSQIAENFFNGVFNFDLSKISLSTIFVISFVSGFSERFVLRAMELMTKEK